MLIKKYGVWIALMLTMAATFWLAQQEKTNLALAEPALPQAVSVKHLALAETAVSETSAIETSVFETSVTEPFTQRLVINDDPQNIFSAFLGLENNLEMQAAPAITLPANPFVYVGKMVDEGVIVVFLVDGEKSHAVKVGDIIEESWKILTITPPSMTLKYLPLKVNLQMDIGANS